MSYAHIRKRAWVLVKLVHQRHQEGIAICALSPGSEERRNKGLELEGRPGDAERGGDGTIPSTLVGRDRYERSDRYSETDKKGKAGSWEYSIGDERDLIWLSEGILQMYGIHGSQDGLVPLALMEKCILERDMVRSTFREMIHNDGSHDIEYEMMPLDGGPRRVVHSVAEIIRDADGRPKKIMGTIHDITDSKFVSERLKHMNRELLAIKECDRALVRAKNEQDLLQDICRIVRDIAGYGLAWVGMAMDDERRSIVPVAWSGYYEDYVQDIQATWGDDEYGMGVAGMCVKTGTAQFIQDIEHDPRSGHWRKKSLMSQFRSVIALPLLDSDIAFGTILLYSYQVNGFTPEEIALLEEMAHDLSFGIVTLRVRKEKEKALEVIQRKNAVNKALLGLTQLSTSDAQELLKRALDDIMLITHSQIGYVGLLDEKGSALSIRQFSAQGLDGRHINEGARLFKIDDVCLWAETIRQAEPVVMNDHDAHMTAWIGELFGNVSIDMHMCVPILERGRVVGVAGLGTTDSPYTSNDAADVSFLADRTWSLVRKIQTQKELADSEQNFRNLIENAPEAIYLATDQFRFAYVNPSAVKLFGARSENDLLGTSTLDRIHPSLHPLIRERVNDLTVEKRPVETLEEVYLRMDGTPIDVEVNAVPLTGRGNVSMMIIIRDITVRKRAEEALEKRLVALTRPLDDIENIEFEDLFNIADLQSLQDMLGKAWGVGVLLTRPDGTHITKPSNFTYFCSEFIRKSEKGSDRCKLSDVELGRNNPTGPTIRRCRSAGLWGAGASITIGGRHIANWLIGQVRNEAQSEEEMVEYAREIGVDEIMFREAFLQVPVMPQEKFMQIADALFALSNQLSAIAYQNIQQARFISERKLAEDALRKANLIVENSPVVLFRWRAEPGWPVDLVSKNIVRFGYEPDMFLNGSLTYTDIIHPEDVESVRSTLEKKIKKGEDDFEDIYRIRSRDGSYHWVDERTTIERSAEGKVTHLQGIVIDITERIEAEKRLQSINKALREGEEKYQELFELGSEAVFLIENSTGKILECNTAASEMYGYSHKEMMGSSSSDLVINKDGPESKAIENRNGSVIIPLEYHRRKDGRVFPVEINSRYFTWKGDQVHVAAVRDITDRIRTSEALRQVNKKMSLLNSITRHDLNNQMTTLTGNLALAQLKRSDPSFDKYMQKALASADSMSAIIKFAEAYEEIGVHDAIWQDLKTLVIESVGDVPPNKIRIVNDLPAGVEVYADPLIRKVFFNMIDNAVRHGENTTTIRFSIENVDGKHSVVCEDDGVGISADVKSKLFNRGFGKNHGLGLFLSREILAITGITLTEEGEPGHGARFVMTLPKNGIRGWEW